MDHTQTSDRNNSFSPFPFDELSITCPEIAFWDPSSFDHVLYPDITDPFGANNNTNDKGKEATVPTGSEDQTEGGSMPPDQKKAMHRDIERQRRQEMSGLYASLRSVLPAEVLKGKRSISDQINEATKYIKCMEDGIKDLGCKKDAWSLRRDDSYQSLPDPPLSESGGGGSSNRTAVTVTVQACGIGVEVLINGDFDTNFPMSRVLEILVREGLNVVSCNYTKFDGKSCYMIQSEVGSGYPSINLQTLRRKLTALINKLTEIQP